MGKGALTGGSVISHLYNFQLEHLEVALSFLVHLLPGEWKEVVTNLAA